MGRTIVGGTGVLSMEVGIFDNDLWCTELERVQRKVARFVMGDYKTTSSVKSMLEHLKWPTLEERRKRAKVTMIPHHAVFHDWSH
jgi:hypothetical protein